jgi:hypothetical protein
MTDGIDEVEQMILEAFGQTVADYNVFVDEIIESTEEFGDLGFTGQDIIDTGRLKDSKMVDSTETETSFEWSPKSPENGFSYAPAVWAGFYPWGREKFVPGRHWPERAAIKLNDEGVTKTFVNYLRQQGLNAEILSNGDEELDD